jgi:hypothetical protein
MQIDPSRSFLIVRLGLAETASTVAKYCSSGLIDPDRSFLILRLRLAEKNHTVANIVALIRSEPLGLDRTVESGPNSRYCSYSAKCRGSKSEGSMFE